MFFSGKKVTKKNSGSSQEMIELLFWKSEFKKVNNALKDCVDCSELQQRKKAIEKKLDAAERAMYEIEKGLYFGVAYELNTESSPKPTKLVANWSKLNNHVGFKGTTRVGKTVNMESHIEQCIARGMDVIVIDPKGGEKQEVLSSVLESAYRYKRAEDFMYYSMAFREISENINVCYGLGNTELTDSIVDSITTKEMDSFYLEVAEQIVGGTLAAFDFLQEVSDPGGEMTRALEERELMKYFAHKNNRDMSEYSFINISEDRDFVDDYLENVVDEKAFLEFEENGFNRTLITFRELEYYSHFKNLKSLKVIVESIEIDPTIQYKRNIKQLRRDALVLLNGALNADPVYFSKVSKTLTNRLTNLSTGDIGELLCGTRINPLMNRLLREDKGVVSVIHPFPMKYKKSAQVFNKMILGMLNGMMGAVGAEGRGLPRRVALFIDEAGAVAYPGIQDFFNRAGGLGISVFVYTQTDEDYKEAVGDTLSSIILDNVNTTGIMRQNALKSIQAASEEIGMVKQMQTIAMVGTGGNDGRYTTVVNEEYLCSPQDIKSLPVGEGILMHDGKTYYVEFPFRRAPLSAVKMPELAEEKAKRRLANFERLLEEEAAQNG